MPPPAKKQKNSAGSAVIHDEASGQTCAAAGQAKAASQKQRMDSAHGTLMKPEWCGLSQRAQSRHVKNEVRARIRAMIPGLGKVTENGLMLQAASRIKELELEIHSLSNYLERLQKLPSSNGSEDNLDGQSVATDVPTIEQGKDGLEALRSVLPQPTKANGKKLLEYTWQYLTELVQEKNQVVEEIAKRKAALKPMTPPA